MSILVVSLVRQATHIVLYRKVSKYIVGILLSYTFLLNCCQQAGLNIGEEDIAQSKPPAKVKQDTQASAVPKSPGTELAVTSVSDTSPEDKQVVVVSSNAAAKRLSTEQLGEEASLALPNALKKKQNYPGIEHGLSLSRKPWPA